MSTPSLALCGALGLGVVAFGAAALSSSAGEARGATPDELVRTDDSTVELRARLDELGEAQRALAGRVLRLEMRAPEERRAPVVDAADASVSRSELDRLREELLGILSELRGHARKLEASNPVELEDFRAEVARALTEIRAQKARDGKRALERRIGRLDRTVADLSDALELDQAQSELMRSALVTSYDREADVLRRMEQGAGPDVTDELRRADREAHELEVSAFLNEAQLAKYAKRAGW